MGLEQTPALHMLAGIRENPSAEQPATAHGIIAGVEQTPALHVLAGMRDNMSAEQLAGGHGTVAGIEQTPAPLQVLAGVLDRPSVEQLAPGQASAGWQAVPLARHWALVVHVAVAQAAAQQTLFVPVGTQLPLAQSVDAVQVDPSPSGGLHSPPMQR